MTALTQPQADALNIALRNSTPLSRLSFAEVQAVFDAMTNAGFAIQAIGSTGGNVMSDAELSIISDFLRSNTQMSRLATVEADAVLSAIRTMGYLVTQPGDIGWATR
jgi:hypothetical protein